MTDISNKDWYKEALRRWEEDYGEVPPPWVFRPEGHPLGIGWRMGAGESFMMVFMTWWEQQSMTEAQALEYFKKYSPPPRWLGWISELIWKLDTDPGIDYVYEKELRELEKHGFEGTSDFLKDYDDPKWPALN